MIGQVQLFDSLLDNIVLHGLRNALDSRVEPQVLFHSHQIEDSVLLRAVADQLSSLLELSRDVVTGHGDGAGGRLSVSGQTLESGRLTGTVNTEESETLTVVQAEADSFYSQEGRTKRGSVCLSEIADSDNFGVVLTDALLFGDDIIVELQFSEGQSRRSLFGAESFQAAEKV